MIQCNFLNYNLHIHLFSEEMVIIADNLKWFTMQFIHSQITYIDNPIFIYRNSLYVFMTEYNIYIFIWYEQLLTHRQSVILLRPSAKSQIVIINAIHTPSHFCSNARS